MSSLTSVTDKVKVVPEGCFRYFFGVKVKTVKLKMAFTQIMVIWTPAITL